MSSTLRLTFMVASPHLCAEGESRASTVFFVWSAVPRVEPRHSWIEHTPTGLCSDFCALRLVYLVRFPHRSRRALLS